MPGENKRQIQKEQTRMKIIAVAIDEFSKNGLINTRTSDIAKLAHVSHGTIFSHFPTKDNLLENVIDEFASRLTLLLYERVNNNDCTIAQLLEAHLIGISEYEDFYTKLILEVRMINEPCRNLVILLQSGISFYLDKIIEKNKKEHKIKDIPTDLIFNTWIGLVHHYLINSDIFCGEGTFYERNGNKLINHFLELIRI